MEPTANPEYQVRIRELPTSERPRERLRDQGPAALTSAELLAIVLRSGTSKQNVLTLAQGLLQRHKGLAGLSLLSFPELLREPGLGEAKAAEIRAVFELASRVQALEVGERPVIRSPADVFALLGGEMAPLEQEHMRVVLVNSRNQVVGHNEVYVGNVSSAVVRAAEVFRAAVRQNAPSIILVHNHPSGDPSPSSEDVSLTQHLVEAGRLLDIDLLDHIVIGRQKFASLKSLGLWAPASANAQSRAAASGAHEGRPELAGMPKGAYP
jgi:DNA repair protein RadC